MDLTTIQSLIGSLGFPIVCTIALFYQNNKLQQTLAELSKTLSVMNDRISDVEEAVKRED